jgi:hypothetical protein
MIFFLRRIRKDFVQKGRFRKYLLYAAGEIVLVMVGILLALQVNGWHENSKTKEKELFILSKLKSDLSQDLKSIEKRKSELNIDIANLVYCLEVLKREKHATIDEFSVKFGGMIKVKYFLQNKTSFDNLVSSGNLELISNKSLSNSLIQYYNLDYKGWDSALMDYTRTILAPYLMRFDHLPQMSKTDGIVFDKNIKFYEEDVDKFDVKSKLLDDYRKDLFELI